MLMNQLPNHVALIVDGNRRWARRAQMPFFDAYKVAGGNLVDVVCTAADLDIKNVTAFLFSTENWKRDTQEVHAVMTAFKEILYDNIPRFQEHGVRIHTIGANDELPPDVQDVLNHTAQETQHCGTTNFVLAFNYGGRWDIVNAVRKLNQEWHGDPNCLTEEQFSTFLSTAPFGDPDLLIRTSGQQRVSNFLMWQLAYSELYFSDLLWPDFSPEHFKQALEEYAVRERRGGS
jgi:undecaprenyl diphosphate synthase